LTTSEIKIWDRVDWGHVRTLEPAGNSGIGSMWANQMYLLASSDASVVTIWDVRKGSAIGSFKIDGARILHVRADKQHIFIATGEKLIVVSLTLGQQQLDLSVEDNPVISQTVLKTSPYDVLESVLDLQRGGDEQLENGAFHDAVAEYEQALQLLIDNTHALLEVPSERESLTYELNERLGYSLLRAKIQELDQITRDISFVFAEFDEYGRSSKDESELDKMWNTAARAIKESRVLAEAQAGHILSYQLAYATDVLESELNEAKRKFEEYQEKINEALTLTQSIRSEWRWLERKRTPLAGRESFLDGAIKTLQQNIAAAGDDREVTEILGASLAEFTHLSGQIKKILEATQSRPQKLKLSKEESADAIAGLLGVLDKRRSDLEKIDNESERNRERNQMLEALQQALEAAELNKMKSEIAMLSKAIASLQEEPTPEAANPEESKPSEKASPPKEVSAIKDNSPSKETPSSSKDSGKKKHPQRKKASKKSG
jgi:DNA repair exonuclease SbcCD ATPase subunit